MSYLIDVPGDNSWADTHFDVVVVGGGGSGLAAALSAAQEGASVVVLEKGRALGGSTARSIGSISAANTSQQRLSSIEDRPEWHFEDMAKFAPDRQDVDNTELRRALVDNCGETVKWLEATGVRFLGPMEEPPHRVPRMLNVLPNSRSYTHYLGRACAAAGVSVLRSSPAKSLLRAESRIVGVEYVSAGGEPRRVHASRGVILAGGDFSGSKPLKLEHLGDVASEVPALTTTNTGDGILMGVAAGGSIRNGQFAAGPQLRFVEKPRGLLLERLPPSRLLAAVMRLAWRFLPDRLLRPFIMGFATTNLAPRKELFADGALLVSQDGRCIDGQSQGACSEVLSARDRSAYIVLDAKLAHRYDASPNYVSTAPGLAYAYLGDYRRNRRDIYHEARSLAGLAKRIGVPAESLEAAWENDSRQGAREAEGPFVALGPVRPWIIITDGGLRIDANFRVLGNRCEAIPGLYAVGSTGQGGLVLEGHGHHLGWAFTSGRLCGQRLASHDGLSRSVVDGEVA